MSKANISWITEQIATGGDFSFSTAKATKQLEDLLSQQLDLVIDCRQEASDEDIWDETDVDYLYLPTDDRYGHHIPASHFDAAVEKAMPVIDGGGKVFIHCHMGVNRGPSTAYAVLLAAGVPPIKAFDLIREKRPIAAIYYAEDALLAHCNRTGKSSKAYLERLRRHINKVITPLEQRRINHTIRGLHEQDSLEMRMA